MVMKWNIICVMFLELKTQTTESKNKEIVKKLEEMTTYSIK